MEEKNETVRTAVNPTPYDDAFKTLMNDCGRLVLKLLNEVFKESYDDTYRVVYGTDEHHILMPDGSYRKITGDEHFFVTDSCDRAVKQYIFECQSYADNTMDVRIYEYASAAAIESQYTDEEGHLHICFPEAGVLYLRGKGTHEVEKSPIYVHFPDQTVEYDVKIVRYMNFNIDELFERKLYILLPFSMFYFENNLAVYEDNANELKKLQSTFVDIKQRLDEAVNNGNLYEHEKFSIINMTETVVNGIAKKFENVRKGVNDIMGGKVLDYESKHIYNEGLREGQDMLLITIIEGMMKRHSMSLEEACAYTGITTEDYTRAKGKARNISDKVLQ